MKFLVATFFLLQVTFAVSRHHVRRGGRSLLAICKPPAPLCQPSQAPYCGFSSTGAAFWSCKPFFTVFANSAGENNSINSQTSNSAVLTPSAQPMANPQPPSPLARSMAMGRQSFASNSFGAPDVQLYVAGRNPMAAPSGGPQYGYGVLNYGY